MGYFFPLKIMKGRKDLQLSRGRRRGKRRKNKNKRKFFPRKSNEGRICIESRKESR